LHGSSSKIAITSNVSSKPGPSAWLTGVDTQFYGSIVKPARTARIEDMPYRRPYYRRGRRQKSPQTSSQETADQALREIYRQARREISEQSQNLRINLFGLLFSGIVSVVPSVAIVGVLFWYLFSFAFPLPPRHVSPYYETGHAVVVLVILVSAIYFPGTVLNYYLWPKILKIAGFIVVAVAFYRVLLRPRTKMTR
jgi:hypothetical protein